MTDNDVHYQYVHRRHQSENGRIILAASSSRLYTLDLSSDTDHGTGSQRSTPRRRRHNSGELSLSIQGFGAYGDSVYNDEDDDIPVRDIGLDASWLEISNNAAQQPGNEDLVRKVSTEGEEEEELGALCQEIPESRETCEEERGASRNNNSCNEAAQEMQDIIGNVLASGNREV
ncbi:hypothetical protein BaRGS_00024428 [Batillaria attramentaria]|uniref:Uncharacterized protein n=1 Tax=Batillaria attramentaria TaxID=370345 RepID=A0ABD0KB22_9CAEN